MTLQLAWDRQLAAKQVSTTEAFNFLETTRSGHEQQGPFETKSARVPLPAQDRASVQAKLRDHDANCCRPSAATFQEYTDSSQRDASFLSNVNGRSQLPGRSAGPSSSPRTRERAARRTHLPPLRQAREAGPAGVTAGERPQPPPPRLRSRGPGETHCRGPWPGGGAPAPPLAAAPPEGTVPPPRAATAAEALPWAARLPRVARCWAPAAASQASYLTLETSRRRSRRRAGGGGHRKAPWVPPAPGRTPRVSREDCRKPKRGRDAPSRRLPASVTTPPPGARHIRPKAPPLPASV